MSSYEFLSVHYMNPLVHEKRKFNFLPYIEINIDATGPLWRAETVKASIVNPGKEYFGLISCIRINGAPGTQEEGIKDIIARMLKAALSLSSLQLALPEYTIDSGGCQRLPIYENELQLRESMIPGTTSPGKPGHGTVILEFKPKEFASELKDLLNKIFNLRYKYPTALHRFLIATDMFTLAVSQADYNIWIFMLAASIEVLASAVIAYYMDTKVLGGVKPKDRAYRDTRSRIRDSIASRHQLNLSYEDQTYDIVRLRNIIVHGEPDDKLKIDFHEVDKIKGKKQIVDQIEHYLSPKVRETLREFLKDPEEFSSKYEDQILALLRQK